MDSLVKNLESSAHFDGQNLLAVDVVSGEKHLLRLWVGSEGGQNGKVRGEALRKQLRGRDAGHVAILDDIGNI